MKRLLAISLIAACGISSGDGGYGDGLGDPENPIPQSADEGPYATRTIMDFTVEQVLPPPVELAVIGLRAFGQNPAKSIITVADEAGVPAVASLYDAIPGAIKDRIEGWINDEVAKVRINGKTVQQYATQVAMLAETALTNFAIESTLAITPEKATHTLTGLDFSPAGLDVKVPITGFAADVLTQHPTVFVNEGGGFSLGDQNFGLAIGEYAWLGVNAGVTNLFGADIETTLTSAINCAAIANTVSDKCVLNVCVGHESEIKAICTGGLKALVNEMHSKFSDYNLYAFHMITGTALLVDDTQDGIADRIVDGVWDSEMNIGLGLRKAPSTFTATR